MSLQRRSLAVAVLVARACTAAEAGALGTNRAKAVVPLDADMSRADGDASRPLMATVSRFVNLVFEAYRAKIEAVQEEKARTIEAYRRSREGADPFEDRSREILSRTAIDLRG